MSKNHVRGYALIIILLVVFCAVAFLPPFTMTSVFWIAFIFGLISIAALIYFFRYSFSDAGDAKSKFYGFPIAEIGVIYCVVQLILSLVEMIAASVMPLWVAVLINIIVLAVALAGGIAADTVREEIKRQDTVLKKDVAVMRDIQSLANAIVGQCDDEAVKEDLRKLSEEIRYSDPVSSDATAALEEELLDQLKEIQNAVVEGDYESVKAMTGKVMVNLTERNRICKLNKGA